jgi:hypothetical protein
MENRDSFGQRVKNKTVRLMKIIVGIALVIGICVLAFSYYATYEKGVMAGKVLRISEKGMIFKTYEGKINLETFGALRGASPIAESFDFSVEASEQALIQQLQEAALRGDRVNLHYVKRYVRFPWRGDTKYFATKIEQIGNEQ